MRTTVILVVLAGCGRGPLPADRPIADSAPVPTDAEQTTPDGAPPGDAPADAATHAGDGRDGLTPGCGDVGEPCCPGDGWAICQCPSQPSRATWFCPVSQRCGVF